MDITLECDSIENISALSRGYNTFTYIEVSLNNVDLSSIGKSEQEELLNSIYDTTDIYNMYSNISDILENFDENDIIEKVSDSAILDKASELITHDNLEDYVPQDVLDIYFEKRRRVENIDEFLM